MQQLAAVRLISGLTNFINHQHHRCGTIKSCYNLAFVLVIILSEVVRDGSASVAASSSVVISANTTSLGSIKPLRPASVAAPSFSRSQHHLGENQERDIAQVLESSNHHQNDSFGRNVADFKHVYNFTATSNYTNSSVNDDLNASDSRFVAQSSSRYDSDRDQTLDIDDELSSLYGLSSSSPTSNLEQDELPTDEQSSSNLVEQRAIRELKKILSKPSLSSTADKVKLEALERLRLRQRSRKHAKDSRAKVLEDLLTTAIESHLDQTAKPASKRTRKQKGDGETSKQSISSSLLQSNPDLDPEIVGDAEIVMQHLQGLASGVMGKAGLSSSSDSSLPVWMLDSPSGNGIGTSRDYSGDNNSDDVTTSEQDVEQDSKTSKETNQPKSRPVISGSELPFSKQFKKLKQQISHRRKQLDHIKKMFNVELALSSKDGTLIGKQVSGSSATGGKHRRKHKQQSDEQQSDEPSSINQDDYTVIDDSTLNPGTSSKFRRNFDKQNKMRELKRYLMDNPEILASVMSELTSDADAGSSKRQNLRFVDNSADSDILEGRRGGSLGRHQLRSPADDPLSSIGWEEKPYKNMKARIHRSTSSFGSSSATRPRSFDNGAGLSASLSLLAPRSKSAETILVESLRDRQLMNLARLENFIAERQQQSSRRSSIYAPLNGTSSPTNNLDSGNNFRSSPMITVQDKQFVPRSVINNQTTPTIGYVNGSQVLHHYVMVQSDSPMPVQYQRSNDGTSIEAQVFENPSSNLQQANNNNNEHQQQHSFVYPGQYQELAQVQNTGLPLKLPGGGQYFDMPPVAPRTQLGPTLSRFRDWRDVSQSEASSSQRNSDKTSSFLGSGLQTLSVPYDLTTGSSSNRVSEPLKQPNNQRSGTFPSTPIDRAGPQQQVPMVVQARQGQSFSAKQQQQQQQQAPSGARGQQDISVTKVTTTTSASQGAGQAEKINLKSQLTEPIVQFSERKPSDHRTWKGGEILDKPVGPRLSDETIRPELEFPKSKGPVDYFIAYKEGQQSISDKINLKATASDDETGEQQSDDSAQRRDRSKIHKPRDGSNQQSLQDADDLEPEFGRDNSPEDINDMGPMWAAAA